MGLGWVVQTLSPRGWTEALIVTLGNRGQASSICGKFHSLGMCSLGSKASLGQGQGSLGNRREHGGVRVVATSKAKEDGGCWDWGWGGSGSSEPTDILLPLCACGEQLTGAGVLTLGAETPGIWPRVRSGPVGSPKGLL